MSYLFVYGTLEIPQVFEAVVGERRPAQTALLKDHARFLLQNRVYPGLIFRPGFMTSGQVYSGITLKHLRKLDSYEDRFYRRKRVRVEMGRFRVWAWAYLLSSSYLHLLSEQQWDRAVFERQHLKKFMGTIGARP